MNRFVLLGSQTDAVGQEWCFIFDTETSATIKSPVRAVGASAKKMAVPEDEARDLFAAPSAVEKAPEEPQKKVVADPSGEIETAEERTKRLSGRKVPPAFLGDIRRMHLDPSKTDGKTDVTVTH